MHASFRIELEMFEWMEITSDNLRELSLSIDKIYNTREKKSQRSLDRRRRAFEITVIVLLIICRISGLKCSIAEIFGAATRS